MTASHHTAPPPTSTLRVVSLRLWLPLLLVGAACVVLCIMLGVQYHQFQQDIEHFIQETAHEDALHAQRELETILRREDGSGLDGVVTQLGLRKTVVHAALVDGLGNVRAATRLAWRGQRAHAVVPDYPLPLIAQALQRQREVLDWQPATQRLLVVTPVGFPLQQNEIRNARKGLLLIAYDLQPLRAQSWQAVRQHVLVFGTLILLSALLMVWLARRWVLLPVQALQARMQRIGEGDFSPGPAWKGHGELRLLNDSLESMAQHLQDSQRSLKESQGRYRQLADAAFEAIIIHDGGVILHANIAAEKMLGMAPGSLPGRSAMSIIAEHEHTEVLERMQHRIEGVWLVDMVDAQGALIPCEMSVRQQEVDGKVLRLAAMRDLRERLAAERRIRELTLYDPLTGLSNRQRLLALLAEVLGEVQRDSQHAALVAFNLNAFQSINDSLGMAVGDGVLRALARRLSARLERNQVLGRVQGDTFALLITNLEGGLQSASALAASSVERLLVNIGEPLHIQEHVLHLSAGAGVVMVGDAQHDAAELLRQAETAMHEAKDGGDNRVQFFAPALQQAASARLTLRSELRSVLRQPPGGLLLHYQPQVNQHGQLHGVEALVRWQHAQRGLIPPGMFIAEAEDSGLIVPLGQWVLEEALHCLRRWQRHCANTPHDWAANLTMAVNVSARQFREADFVAGVRRALARSGVAPTALELELTESVVADDLDATLAKIAELRALGVRFALDDFGTGYSSLAYLKRLPIDLLKIDRSFVMDIDAEPDSSLDGAAEASAQGKRPAVLIDAIVALAHQLELHVLAEGVETPAQLARLAQVGCDLYQGYHFSRPLPEDALLAWAEAAAQAGAAP